MIEIKPFSLKYWRAVRHEKKRLRVDRKLGHGWIFIDSENVAECYRCRNRTTSLVDTDSAIMVPDRKTFEIVRVRKLDEEGLHA